MKRTRLFCVLLAAAMLLSLAACGKGTPAESNLIKLGDYELLYKGASIMEDSDGNDALVLTLDFTNNSDNVLTSECLCFCKSICSYTVFIKYDLKQTGTVSQVNKDQASQISSSLYPTHNGNGTSDIRTGYLCTSMGSFQSTHGLCHNIFLLFKKFYEFLVTFFGKLLFLEFFIFIHTDNQYLLAICARLLCLSDHFAEFISRISFFNQICSLFRLLRNLETILHQKQDDTLKSDGKSASRNIFSGEVSNHLVVTSAATAASAKLRNRDLKNSSCIVRHTSY